jgi:hypothetical protein
MNRIEMKKTMCRMMNTILNDCSKIELTEKEFYNILNNYGLDINIFEKYSTYDSYVNCNYKEHIYYNSFDIRRIIDFIVECKNESHYGCDYDIEQDENLLYTVTIFYNNKFYCNFRMKEDIEQE